MTLNGPFGGLIKFDLVLKSQSRQQGISLNERNKLIIPFIEIMA
jgi:hypothetical protein